MKPAGSAEIDRTSARRSSRNAAGHHRQRLPEIDDPPFREAQHRGCAAEGVSLQCPGCPVTNGVDAEIPDRCSLGRWMADSRYALATNARKVLACVALALPAAWSRAGWAAVRPNLVLRLWLEYA